MLSDLRHESMLRPTADYIKPATLMVGLSLRQAGSLQVCWSDRWPFPYSVVNTMRELSGCASSLLILVVHARMWGLKHR